MEGSERQSLSGVFFFSRILTEGGGGGRGKKVKGEGGGGTKERFIEIDMNAKFLEGSF